MNTSQNTKLQDLSTLELAQTNGGGGLGDAWDKLRDYAKDLFGGR